MKKIFIFIAILIIIVAIVTIALASYQSKQNAIKAENAEYEKYKDQEVNGLEVATLINKSVDKNTKNEIPKDEKGIFVQNDTNSIEMEIYLEEEDQKYELKMETIFDGGTENFVQYYGTEKFKCSKIEYHEKTGKIKYILFEQIKTS